MFLKKNIKLVSCLLLIFIYITACTSGVKEKDDTIQKEKEIAETVDLLSYYVQHEQKKDSIFLMEIPAKYTTTIDLQIAIDVIGGKKLKAIDLYRQAEKNNLPWSKSSAPVARIMTEKSTRKLVSPVILADYTTVLGDGLYHIAHPIFTKDFKFAILYVEYVCGSRCGDAKTLLFKKDNNIWKLIKTMNTAVF
ncbi:hypothetical protein H7F33_10190 [Pedobacter sp. PAMC26386]|nr:hypothetical protein H7F33_10190 [Pedobacter sp. PAMC26386]